MVLLDARLVRPRDPREVPLCILSLCLPSAPCLGGPRCTITVLRTASIYRLAASPLAVQGGTPPRISVVDTLGRHAPHGRSRLGIPRIRRLAVLIPHHAIPAFGQRGIAPDLALPALQRPQLSAGGDNKDRKGQGTHLVAGHGKTAALLVRSARGSRAGRLGG